jgi:hypothetical protein
VDEPDELESDEQPADESMAIDDSALGEIGSTEAVERARGVTADDAIEEGE